MIGGFIGNPIGGVVNVGLFALQATTGVYVVAGPSAALRASLVVTAGGYAINGQSVAFPATLSATKGSYALSGNATTLNSFEPVTAGAYTLSGNAALLKVTAPIATGAYTLTGNAATLAAAEAVASGAYAITGPAITFRLMMPVTTGVHAITGRPALPSITTHGAGGESRKPRPARPVEMRLHDRKITVTDRDGKTRKVSYAKRFKAPPPREEVPAWFFPQPPASPLSFDAPLRRVATSGLPTSYELARIRAIEAQDEEDILAFVQVQDPLVADVARAVAALAVAGSTRR
jgi:hypothetical protein